MHKKTKAPQIFLGDALNVVSPAGPEGREPEPKWNLLFPLGATKHRADFPGGKIHFDAAFLGAIEANFRKMQARYKGPGKFRLQANYHHRGASVDNDTTPIDAKVASGWIEDIRNDDVGTWGLMRWTGRARGYILADELCCLSPEFAVQYRDTDTGKPQGPTLLGVALLNDPFLKENPRVAASDNTVADEADGEPHMNKKLLALLKLAEDANDEAAIAALEALISKLASLEEGAVKLTAATSEVTTLTAARDEAVTKLTATEAKLSEAEGKLSKLAADAKEKEAAAFVESLVKGGKIVAAQSEAVKKVALRDMDEAKALFASAKPVVELGERGVQGATETTPEDGVKRFSALMDEHTKSGMSAADAAAKIRRDHPELAKPVTA